MKKLIAFDLDGTLAASKSSLDAEMSSLLHDLLAIAFAWGVKCALLLSYPGAVLEEWVRSRVTVSLS